MANVYEKCLQTTSFDQQRLTVDFCSHYTTSFVKNCFCPVRFEVSEWSGIVLQVEVEQPISVRDENAMLLT